ncbi:hypothetical protein A5N83_21820 [Rhodococcus sp. 1139]|nr:hypothetical protein A5N83_21820 [Rhodococcus sp. 1139]
MPPFASARMGDPCAPVSGTVPADTDESDCAGAAENTVCALSSPMSTDGTVTLLNAGNWENVA